MRSSPAPAGQLQRRTHGRRVGPGGDQPTLPPVAREVYAFARYAERGPTILPRRVVVFDGPKADRFRLMASA